MNKFTNPLSKVRIASPCPADWEAMVGDERRRFCGECKLNVYNLSGMTKAEAENLLANAEGRLCVRYYRRDDGTILTQDCPVGWAALKRRVSKIAAAFVSLVFGVLSGLGLTAYFSKPDKPEFTMGSIAYQPTPKPTPKETPRPLMGAIAMPSPTPKETPKPKSTPRDAEVGEIYIPVRKPPTQKSEKDLALVVEKAIGQGS